MIQFNLDDCMFYTYDENEDCNSVIKKESILTYMDYPIGFFGDVGKSFTLRKFRAMLNNYPYLLLPYLSFNDFIRITKNIGFKVVNDDDNIFEKIIVGKNYNIRRSDLTLVSQSIVSKEKTNVSSINDLKIERSYFVREYEVKQNREIRIDCYAKGKIVNKEEYSSLSTEKIIDIYDLPIEIANDRYIEYIDHSNEEKDDIIKQEKIEDIYLSYDSLTLKDLLDAIDIDIEFWENEDIEDLNKEIKELEKRIKKYKELEESNKK